MSIPDPPKAPCVVSYAWPTAPRANIWLCPSPTSAKTADVTWGNDSASEANVVGSGAVGALSTTRGSKASTAKMRLRNSARDRPMGRRRRFPAQGAFRPSVRRMVPAVANCSFLVMIGFPAILTDQPPASRLSGY